MAVDGILYPVVPRDASRDAHVDVVAFVGRHVDLLHPRVEYRPAEIVKEQQVGAAADVEQGRGVACVVVLPDERLQFVNGVVVHEVRCFHVDAECVVPEERAVILDNHVN